MTSPWLSGLGAGLQDFAGSLERSRELDAKKEMAMAELAQKDKDRNQWKYIGAIDYGDGRGPVPSVYNQEQGQTVPADRIPGSYHGGGGESPPPTTSGGEAPQTFTPPSGADWTKALRVPAGGPTAPPAGPPSSDQAMAQLTGSTLPTVPRPSAATLPPGAPAGAPASFSTSGIPRVVPKPAAPKAPLLGTAEYNDAEVAKAKALAQAKQSADSASIVNLAPIKATADSLAQAKKTQAELAANPGANLETVTLPDGSKVLKPKAPGLEVAPDLSNQKAASAQMVAAMNRLGLSEGDISNAAAAMDKFENDPKNRAMLTAANNTLGAVAQSVPNAHSSGITSTISDAATTFAAAKARQKLNAEFPGLLTYLRNKQIVGLAATEILPRPNQQLLGIESMIAGIANDTPDEIVSDVQSRRHRMADLIRQSLQSTPLGKKTLGNTAKPATNAAVDPVLAKYGLTPKPE